MLYNHIKLIKYRVTSLEKIFPCKIHSYYHNFLIMSNVSYDSVANTLKLRATAAFQQNEELLKYNLQPFLPLSDKEHDSGCPLIFVVSKHITYWGCDEDDHFCGKPFNRFKKHLSNLLTKARMLVQGRRYNYKLKDGFYNGHFSKI